MRLLTCVLLLAVSLLAGTPAVSTVKPYYKLPLSFVANHGQFDPQVKFASRGKDYALYLTAEQAVLALKDTSLRMSFVGAGGSAEVTAVEQLPGKVNYFIGREATAWRTGIPTFGRVRYREVWPGIDLVFYGNQGRLEYDFVVAPGADPNQVRLRFDGADTLRLDGDQLIATAGQGEIVQLAPIIYQQIEGERLEVAGHYKVDGREVSFELSTYDPTEPLVIDPILVYASFLGGSDDDEGRGIVVDDDKNIYITGLTISPNFPTMDPFQAAIGGTQADAFITKINADGSAIVYSTYVGGADSGDIGYGIAVDEDHNAYIVGVTSSMDYPTTTDVIQPALAGNRDAFVTKLNADGDQLLYSTFLGGTRSDQGFGIALNVAGEAFITGETASDNFPVAPGAFQPTRNGPGGPIEDVFVARLNDSGTSLIYSTYVGGTDTDRGQGIAVDSTGHAYVTGVTGSDDFPSTAGSLQTGNGGTNDAFVFKIMPDGSNLVYSTYLGGSNIEAGHGIALDFANNAYVIGDTQSRDFPTTPNVVQPEWASNLDVFVAKINPTGSALLYATYLGGSARDHGQGIAVDTATTAYITGWTASTNFPEVNPLPNTKGSSGEAFIARLSFDASFLHFSTYYGGDLEERVGDSPGNGGGNPIAVDSECKIYTTGRTMSPNFPLNDPFQVSFGGANDAFALKVDPVVPNDGPSIGCRGVVLANLAPTVRKVSPNSLVSVFGDELTDGAFSFQPGTDADGNLARSIANTCVEMNDIRTPMLGAIGFQTNFQALHDLPAGWAKVRVVRNCGQPDEVKSPPEYVQVVPTTPAFFNATFNPGGVNPIAALHQDGISRVGPPGLFPTVETTPAAPGEFVSMYFTGGGMTNPSFAEGEIPGVAAPVTAPVELTIGGTPITGDDLYYVGVAPCCAGLYQAVGRIPPNAQSGNHEVRLKIGDEISPAGPFIAVTAP